MLVWACAGTQLLSGVCRQRYVEEQLAKRLGRPAPGSSVATAPDDPEQHLYNVPQELRVSSPTLCALSCGLVCAKTVALCLTITI